MTHPPLDDQQAAPSARPAYPAYPGSMDVAQPLTTPGPPVAAAVPDASLRVPATILTVFAVILTVVEIGEAALAWPVQSTLITLVDGGDAGFGVLNAYDALVYPWTLSLLGAFVATGIWLHRAHVAAKRLRPKHQARSAGWAWGGWITPVVSLWFPFQVVRDASLDPVRTDRSALRGWWWGLWLASLFTSQLATYIVGTSVTREQMSLIGAAETANALLTVAALVLWLRVVSTLTGDHETVARTVVG